MDNNIMRESDLLADVPNEYVFYLNDGRLLHNLDELIDAFNSMNDELYAYHVTPEKNDFYNWVVDIIHDDKLAKDLKRANNRAAAGRVITKRVAYLKSKIK